MSRKHLFAKTQNMVRTRENNEKDCWIGLECFSVNFSAGCLEVFSKFGEVIVGHSLVVLEVVGGEVLGDFGGDVFAHEVHFSSKYFFSQNLSTLHQVSLTMLRGQGARLTNTFSTRETMTHRNAARSLAPPSR